jgi:outer membrane receptor protein involved in Fe transport
MKISGGVGLFYDNVPLEHFQAPQLERRSTSTISIDPSLENPYGIHWNLSWEHEWAPRWVTRTNFIQKQGGRQIRLGAPGGDENLEINNSGETSYRGIELSLDRPVRTNLHFLASYVYSRVKARPSLAMDFPDPALEGIGNAPVSWDAPHRFLGWGYFPFLANTNASFSTEARSGFPYTAMNTRGETISGYNANRLPVYVVVNFNIEKETPAVFGRRLAVRVGVMNLLNRFNPRFVDLDVSSPTFMQFSDSSGRKFVARLRILK